jgi:hypothetical protein
MDNTASCPVCGGCEAEDALLSIMQFADQAPDPTADPYGAEAAFGRIVEMARAASQERPQPHATDALAFAEQGHCASDCCDWYPKLHVHGDKAEYDRWLAQERPSIDVERLIEAHQNVWGLRRSDFNNELAERIAAEYLRLSGPVGE